VSYNTKISVEEQQPFAELYEMSVGSDIKYYTTYSQDVLFAGNTYQAKPIRRGDFNFSQNLRSVKLKIDVPLTETIQRYIANSPVEPISIKITRVFLDESGDSIVIFQGEVIDVTITKYHAQVYVESYTKVFRNKIPKAIFQARCNHMVFDERCGLIENNYKVEAIVTVNQAELTSNDFTAYDSGYFTGGHVVYDGDMRLITRHSGDTLNLHIPFDGRLTTGKTVAVYPGCDKTPSTCKNKYGNFTNFLGFPYIPESNPTIWGFE